jgi:hypothetical protein
VTWVAAFLAFLVAILAMGISAAGTGTALNDGDPVRIAAWGTVFIIAFVAWVRLLRSRR